MEKFELFRSDLLVRKNIGSLDQCSSLLKEILEIKSVDIGVNFSNKGCWRTNKQLTINWLLPEIKILLDQFMQIYNYELEPKGFNSDKVQFSYWTNVNSPQSRNTVHSHENSHFSCVYYVQATGTGNLRLVNPANILGNCNPTAPFIEDIIFTPEDRDLIMWPSWVPHEVESNFSDKDRICIAFDITMKK